MTHGRNYERMNEERSQVSFKQKVNHTPSGKSMKPVITDSPKADNLSTEDKFDAPD